MKEFAYIPEDGSLPAVLQAVPFLNTFTDEQLDDVLNSSNLLQCDVGDAIIREGSIDSRFYILLSGELEVRVGHKSVARISRAGEVFGELALVNQDKRLASVVAATKAVCLAVDQKFLHDIHPREEDPAFHASLYEFVARLIAKKLDFTSRRVADLEKQLEAANKALAKAAPAKTKPAKIAKPAAKKAPAPAKKAPTKAAKPVTKKALKPQPKAKPIKPKAKPARVAKAKRPARSAKPAARPKAKVAARRKKR